MRACEDKQSGVQAFDERKKSMNKKRKTIPTWLHARNSRGVSMDSNILHEFVITRRVNIIHARSR